MSACVDGLRLGRNQARGGLSVPGSARSEAIRDGRCHPFVIHHHQRRMAAGRDLLGWQCRPLPHSAVDFREEESQIGADVGVHGSPAALD